MRVKFLGVGEAFDELLPNVSIWVRSQADGGAKSSVLLDCGFTAPPRFWANCPDPEDLDALWISHFHGDHYLGIPALLTRFWESGRKKPLLIVGQEGVETIVLEAMRMAYASMMERFAFELNFLELAPAKAVDAAGYTWRAAVSGHPRKDLALRLERGGKSLFYSGDGPPTDETLSLARGCDLAIHEAYTIEPDSPAHGSFRTAIDLARTVRARALALVHVQRNERRERREEISHLMESIRDVRVFMPEPDEELVL